jgi:hypothetical protein
VSFGCGDGMYLPRKRMQLAKRVEVWLLSSVVTIFH